jgi:hypothetical protein
LKGADHLALLRIFRYGETHFVGRFFTLIVVVILILIVAQYLVLDKIKDRLQRDHPQAWGSFRFPEPRVNWDEDEPIQNGAEAALRKFLQADRRYLLADKALNVEAVRRERGES